MTWTQAAKTWSEMVDLPQTNGHRSNYMYVTFDMIADVGQEGLGGSAPFPLILF